VVARTIIVRLIFDAFVITGILVYFKIKTVTSAYNFIAVLFLMCVGEILILLNNSLIIFRKSVIECLEGMHPSPSQTSQLQKYTGLKPLKSKGVKNSQQAVPPFVLHHCNNKIKSIVLSVNIR